MSLADSPFVDRLNTNYVPSDSEICEIRALLVDPLAELARLDAQIEEIEITLSQLKEKRASLKAPIDAHRALIAPMRRIPQDVLVEIFISCLPSEHNALIDPTEAPLLLGRICGDWRCVAYSTPMLWSSIHIPSFDYHVVPPDILLELEKMVEAWLERSGTCSLSVSLFDPTVHSTLGAHPLISQLLPVSQRLRRLALSRFGDAEFFRPLLQLGSEALPLLRSVQIETTANLLFQDHPEAMNVFHIPTLENVSLRISESVNPLSLPLKWSQLTELNLACHRLWTQNGPEGGLDFGGALDVLRMCPNLRRCEFRMTKAREDAAGTMDPTPIILPHIHTLIFKGRLHFNRWSPHLVIPHLRYLQVGEETSGDSANLPTQDVDGCTRAHIDPHYFTPSGLHELLQSFPTISHLQLSTPAHLSLDDAFLALFCPPHELCPLLTHITLAIPGAEFSGAAVLAFVRSRMAMPTPLQQVGVQLGRTVEVDIIAELQSFISDGLKVDLEYPSSEWKFKARAGLHGLDSLY